jgi:tripartite-type tricarboxylate transporter receptor subunit TctC
VYDDNDVKAIAAAVARSRPDGYTLLLGAPTLATVKITMKAPPIDPLRELDPLTQLVETPYVIAVNAQLPVVDLRQFIAYAKAHPGTLNYGTWSTGGQLTYGFFKQLTGVDFIRVGYKGEALTMTALGGNEVQVAFGTSITVMPGLKVGTVRALAVSSAKRLPGLSNIPTTSEAGLKEFNEVIWFGLFAPAGTPNDVKSRISEEIREIAAIDDVISRLRVAGFEAKTSTPGEFSEFVAGSSRKWSEVAKSMGIEPQ